MISKYLNKFKPSSKIIFSVFFGLSILASYFVISTYLNFLSEAEESALKRLEAIVATVSFQLDGDEHKYVAEKYTKVGQLTSNKEDSVYYKLWKSLRNAQQVNKLETELSTLVLNKDSTMSYIMNSLDSPFIRDPYIYDKQFLNLYETGGVIHQYTDEFGTWLSAVMPIHDSIGNVVAIVEVDDRFDTFIFEARKQLFKHLIVTSIISLLIAVVIMRSVKKIALADEEAKRKIEESNHIISQKNKDILDSINYAQRIQAAILAPKSEIFDVFKDAFILYKPKDIISGDFYYFSKVDEHVIIAAADCTGHGVPGALMSMIGNDLLNHITHEKKTTTPSEILDQLHIGITNVLKQDGKHGETRDGMDISLLSFELKNMLKLQYAGAYRSLCIVRNGELIEYKANKFPIGNAQQNRDHFTNNVIELKKGDMCYFFTDGYADQFGGEQGKKFMVKKFHRLLIELSPLNVNEQQLILETTIEDWRKYHEQVDDILVIGIRV